MATFRELFGEKFNPEMTLAEAEKFFEGRRLADVSTGEYVSKAKYEADTKRLAELQSEHDGKQAEIDAAVAKAVEEAKKSAKADYDKQLESERTADKRKRAKEKALTGLSEEQRGVLEAYLKDDELKLADDGESFSNFEELAKPVRERFKTLFPKDDGSNDKGGVPPTGDKKPKNIDEFEDYKNLR